MNYGNKYEIKEATLNTAGSCNQQLTSLSIKRQNFILKISVPSERNTTHCNYCNLQPCFQCPKLRLLGIKQEQLQSLRIT